MSKPSPQTISRPISPKFPPLNPAASRNGSPGPPKRLGQSPLPPLIQTIRKLPRKAAVQTCARPERRYKSSRIVPCPCHVLNALTKIRGLPRDICAFGESRHVVLRTSRPTFAAVVFRFGQRPPLSSRRRQNTSAHFAETDTVTISLTPTGNR